MTRNAKVRCGTLSLVALMVMVSCQAAIDEAQPAAGPVDDDTTSDIPVAEATGPSALEIHPDAVNCESTLTPDNPAPTVGQEVTFSFETMCRCGSDGLPGTCYFALYSRESVQGEGFDFSGVGLGPGNTEDVAATAVTAGGTEVTMQYYGETTNGNYWSWHYETASATLDVQPSP